MPGGGSSGEQYSISQQLYAAASAAAARAKRPRVAELGSSLQYSPLASSSNSNVLPPIRVGIDPTPGAALGHGQMAEERSDSLQYTKDRKGKMAASSSASASADVVGVGASSGSARSAARGVKRAPNPEAQPTPGWLSTQRRYKVGLLHLLTLESFYPSDVAMLNTFRAQGDFTNEQIETHGAALLSWARSWLRYNRNAVLRSTLENKAKMPLAQLAEALQHDLHAETDFTAVHNMRRCALLRLIYYQWQAINKLGTKSQSLYRDYESRLREIEALPTAHEQEAEWRAILDEEQARRSALIRESRGSGGSTILPRPAGEQNIQQQRHRPPITSAMPRGNAPLILPLRSTVLDWPTHSATEATVLEQQQQQHYAQHYAVAAASMGSPSGGAQQQQREAMDVEGSQERRMQTVGKDDDSEMSVKLSPEPHH
ncbi:hypothetical protein LPJ81_001841 [Coemansia sp. IMI 209127]|nr:hypothetical protein LPJ81_001841 [Coemansia sp. IMI 209127]